MKKLLSLLVLLGFVLVGCTVETEEPKKVEETATQPEEQKEEVKPEQTVFAVGEKIQLGDSVVTVTGVEKSNGGEWDTPAEGKEYVIVSVKIENSGTENLSYNPFYFKIKNSQGVIEDHTLMMMDMETLSSGELAAGGFIEGKIPFEAHIGDTALQLIYQPNMFIDDEIITINLQ
jgi:hypothetical protein